ncbi:STAS domain-containing protein [Terasakiella sp. SH-1]|uniref:STAS domain-containing protein n=1 Tax=Terasakiella sp. SH-1 TaxID=2560057 RepID=UPI001072FFBA|nr:STAS domain-containing protein [Terasakiella sp. SH-1]
MEISIREIESDCVVYLSGKISFLDSELFRSMIDNIVTNKPETCIFDLFDCIYIDSAGLGLLMQAHELFEHHDINFHVRNARDQVHKVLEISSFNRIMSINEVPGDPHQQHL